MKRIKEIFKGMKKEKLIILLCVLTALIAVIISSVLFVSAKVRENEAYKHTETETESETQYAVYSPTSPKSLQYQSLGNGTCIIASVGKYIGEELDIPERSPAGDTVIGIGDHAFEGCEELLSVRIPATVSAIGNSVFKGCTSLAIIEVERANSKFSSSGGILYTKSKDTLICYPAARVGTSYLLNPNVKVIAENAFYGVHGLSRINYEGNTAEFSKIEVGDGNKVFTTLPITCNYNSSK